LQRRKAELVGTGERDSTTRRLKKWKGREGEERGKVKFKTVFALGEQSLTEKKGLGNGKKDVRRGLGRKTESPIRGFVLYLND